MRTLLVVCLLIGGVAAALPSLFTNYLAPASGKHASAVPAEPAAPEASAAHAQSASRQVEVKAGRDGHFYVDAEVNFRPVRLMVDTGATVVALRASDAAEAGIRVRAADFVNPVQTANGTTNAAEAMLESISVSDIELRNVRALIVPDDQLSISLLGGSFLHGLRRFEVTDGILTIEN
jgi:aspartyl protease family protein